MPSDPSDALGEIFRALKFCHPGWEQAPRAAFPARSAVSWDVWRSEVFVAVIRPRLLEAWTAASSGDWRQVVVADQELSKTLVPVSSVSSRQAGSFLASGYSVPPAERTWGHYARALAAGETPGHLAVVLAVRGATFSLPPAAVASACLFLEARSAAPDMGPAEWLRLATEGLARPEPVQLRAA